MNRRAFLKALLAVPVAVLTGSLLAKESTPKLPTPAPPKPRPLPAKELAQGGYVSGWDMGKDSGTYYRIYRLGPGGETVAVGEMRRITKTTCVWKYRSQACNYSGPMPTCDKTDEDCKKHGNLINFGGFPILFT